MLQEEAKIFEGVKEGLLRASHGLQMAIHSDILDRHLDPVECLLTKTELACKQTLLETIRLMGGLTSRAVHSGLSNPLFGGRPGQRA